MSPNESANNHEWGLAALLSAHEVNATTDVDADLPQWTAGANIAANRGGSTYPVFAQSKHPAQAATSNPRGVREEQAPRRLDGVVHGSLRLTSPVS